MSAEYTIGIGIDICEVEKIQQEIEGNNRFIIDTFTDPEIVYCEQPDSNLLRAQRYAARFAGKEAVIKALGGIPGGVDFQEIYILKDRVSGKPFIHLEGKAQAHSETLGVTGFFVSLSHGKSIAIAECRAVSSH